MCWRLAGPPRLQCLQHVEVMASDTPRLARQSSPWNKLGCRPPPRLRSNVPLRCRRGPARMACCAERAGSIPLFEIHQGRKPNPGLLRQLDLRPAQPPPERPDSVLGSSLKNNLSHFVRQRFFNSGPSPDLEWSRRLMRRPFRPHLHFPASTACANKAPPARDVDVHVIVGKPQLVERHLLRVRAHEIGRAEHPHGPDAERRTWAMFGSGTPGGV